MGGTLSVVPLLLTFGFEIAENVRIWDWEPVSRVWFDYAKLAFSEIFDLNVFQQKYGQ